MYNVGNKYSNLDDKILRTVLEVDGGCWQFRQWIK